MFCYIVYIDHDLLHIYLMWVGHFVKSLLEPMEIIEEENGNNSVGILTFIGGYL